jgi:hypothetical protein
MLRSAKLICHSAHCRDHPVHWHLVKGATTLGVMAAFFAPPEWHLPVAVAANVFWIWVEA